MSSLAVKNSPSKNKAKDDSNIFKRSLSDPECNQNNNSDSWSFNSIFLSQPQHLFSSSSSSNQEDRASQNATSYDGRDTYWTEQNKFINHSEIDDVSSCHDSDSDGWVDPFQKPLNKPPWLLKEPLSDSDSFYKIPKICMEISQNKEYKWKYPTYSLNSNGYLSYLFYSLKLQTPNSNYIPSIQVQFHLNLIKYDTIKYEYKIKLEKSYPSYAPGA